MPYPALTSAVSDHVVFLNHPSVEVHVEPRCSFSGMHNGYGMDVTSHII